MSRFLWIILLVGCGGDKEGGDSGSSGTESSSPTTTTPTTSGTTPPTPTPTTTPTTTASVWGEEALAWTEERAGNYEGAWSMNGVDAKGKTFVASTWTDTIEASNPRIEGDRAVLDAFNHMVLDIGFEIDLEWQEGVLIEEDGSMGQQFIDFDGVLTVLTEVKPGEYTYQTDVSSDDLYYVAGVSSGNLISGTHTMVKVVSEVDGKETHTVSRSTTIEYDNKGKKATISYDSLSGTHTKLD
jgi:hypothetical protein